MSFLKSKDIGEKKNSNRNKKTAWIYVLSFLAAIPTLIILTLTENGTIQSNIPVLISILVMTVFILYLNWLWFKNMDEFEKAAIGKACFWGLSSATIVVPWEILHILNIASKPDAFSIVFIALTVTLVLYYYDKFRA